MNTQKPANTVQITFVSSDSLFSFTTSTSSSDIGWFNLMIASAFTLTYIMFSLISTGNYELRTKVKKSLR